MYLTMDLLLKKCPVLEYINTRTFSCEPNNLSNSYLSKHAKKDMLLWVTETGKSTDQNI
jgi:hypothetical protein